MALLGVLVLLGVVAGKDERGGSPTWLGYVALIIALVLLAGVATQIIWGVGALMKDTGVASCSGLYWLDILMLILTVVYLLATFIMACL